MPRRALIAAKVAALEKDAAAIKARGTVAT